MAKEKQIERTRNMNKLQEVSDTETWKLESINQAERLYRDITKTRIRMKKKNIPRK